MFRHPAWAVGSYGSGPPAANTVGTKSMGGFHQRHGSPCRQGKLLQSIVGSSMYPIYENACTSHVLPRHVVKRTSMSACSGMGFRPPCPVRSDVDVFRPITPLASRRQKPKTFKNIISAECHFLKLDLHMKLDSMLFKKLLFTVPLFSVVRADPFPATLAFSIAPFPSSLRSREIRSAGLAAGWREGRPRM